MPTLLFRLDGVPDDEAEAVRDLLAQHGVPCYETPGGRWGLSVAALWLRDRDQQEFPRARALIDAYQAERAARARAEGQERRREGREERLVDRIALEPLRFLFYLAAILAVLYLSLKPFLHFGRG